MVLVPFLDADSRLWASQVVVVCARECVVECVDDVLEWALEDVVASVKIATESARMADWYQRLRMNNVSARECGCESSKM